MLQRVEASRQDLIDADLAPTHGDFHPAQILVEDGYAFLIDLTGLTIADPTEDIGRFLSHVVEGENLIDIAGVKSRFLEVYLRFARPGVEARIPAYEALGYLFRARMVELHPDSDQAEIDALISLAVETAASDI